MVAFWGACLCHCKLHWVDWSLFIFPLISIYWSTNWSVFIVSEQESGWDLVVVAYLGGMEWKLPICSSSDNESSVLLYYYTTSRGWCCNTNWDTIREEEVNPERGIILLFFLSRRENKLNGKIINSVCNLKSDLCNHDIMSLGSSSVQKLPWTSRFR